jgi:hypothetical protein
MIIFRRDPRNLLKITKLAKIDILAKVWANYQKKLKTYFIIEYLVKYFATILSFCC